MGARHSSIARIEVAFFSVAESMRRRNMLKALKHSRRTVDLDLSSVDVVHCKRPAPARGAADRSAWRRRSSALGVAVVYDFRAADKKVEGRARALACREKLGMPAAFVNIGGIANVTDAPDGPAERLIAFDTGAGIV